MGGANLWDALFGALGDAIKDVREKVVEEPWFGRAVTRETGATRSVAEDLGWVRSDTPDAEPAPANNPDLGIDR